MKSKAIIVATALALAAGSVPLAVAADDRRWEADRDERREDRREFRALASRAQELLNELGYDAGPPDGRPGPQTREAVRKYQRDIGVRVDGRIDYRLVAQLEDSVSQLGRGEGGSQEQMLAELKALHREARRRKGAERWLLRDMRRLIQKYDWPWGPPIVESDFRSGRHPDWRVIRGSFEQDERLGLVSAVGERRSRSGEDLFGALLSEALGGERRGRSSRDTIERDGALPELLLVSLRLRVISDEADVTIDLDNRRGRLRGYRLRLDADRRRGSEVLLQIDKRGEDIVLARSGRGLDLADGRLHRIDWIHTGRGGIQVQVDGEVVMEARDDSLQGDFDGISISNRGGEIAIRDVAVFPRR